MRLIAVAFLIFASLFQNTVIADIETRGLWVWQSSAFATPEERDSLISFCLQHSISHLDVHLELKQNAQTYILKDKEAFQSLVQEATRNHITISALRGDNHMFFKKNQHSTLLQLRAILDLDKSLPDGNKLSGIKYDVEPYTTAEWKTGPEARLRVISDYLSCLDLIRSTLKNEAPHLTLAVDIPFWWDNEEFNLNYNGAHKLLSHHIQDMVDYVSIMSYRRTSEKIADSIKDELHYATEIGKAICPSLETCKLTEDTQASFHGTDNRIFWNTIKGLQKEYSGNQNIHMLMIHSYIDLKKYLSNNIQSTAE